MKPSERALLALLLSPCLLILWLYYKEVSDCEKSGGRAVKGSRGWVECVKASPPHPPGTLGNTPRRAD